MKNTEDKYTIQSAMSRIRGGHVNFSPSYQRNDVWLYEQKCKFIESLLKGISIPKFYIKVYDVNNETKWEVIDGQQRLRAIQEFLSNGFALENKMDAIDGNEIAKKTFTGLHQKLQDKINDYNLTIVSVENATDEETSELFWRLNNGTPLTPEDKRRSVNSELGNFIRTKVYEHDFWSSFKVFLDKNNVTVGRKVSKKEGFCARLTSWVIADAVIQVNSQYLDTLYKQYKIFDINSLAAKKTLKILNRLHSEFGQHPKETNGLSIVLLQSLFWMLYLVDKDYSLLPKHSIYDWWITFLRDYNLEKQKMADFKAGRNNQSPSSEWLSFIHICAYSTNTAKNIEASAEYMKKSFLEYHPTIVPLDAKRDFTDLEKQIIYHRDFGKCHICQQLCDYTNYHCDHVIPYSAGGETTIANGRVSCSKCNLKKGNRST